MNIIPKGYCQCGCGQQTSISTFSRASSRRVKGEPLRFVKGHRGGINVSKRYSAQFVTKDDGTVWKTCTKCKCEKEVSHFSTRNGKYYSWCRECNRREAREFYKRNPQPYKDRAHTQRECLRNYLLQVSDDLKASRGCLFCPEKALCVLDFHHIEKGVPVSRAISKGYAAFERETNKCVVLCSNCHRKVHARLLTLNPQDRILGFVVKRIYGEELASYRVKEGPCRNFSVNQLYLSRHSKVA